MAMFVRLETLVKTGTDVENLKSLASLVNMMGDSRLEARVRKRIVGMIEQDGSAKVWKRDDLWEAKRDLVRSQIVIGEYQQAEAMCRSVLEEAAAVGVAEEDGGEHPEIPLLMRSFLAEMLFNEGKHGEAAQLLEEVLEGQLSTHGDIHEHTLHTRMTLALAHKHADSDDPMQVHGCCWDL